MRVDFGPSRWKIQDTKSTNGVFINDVELKPNGTTLGEAFRSAGYHTGYIGKWHIYGSPDGKYGRRLAYIPPEKRFGSHVCFGS